VRTVRGEVKGSWKERFLSMVVARHGRPLLRFFVSRLPNSANAPDLVQEVYMRIVRLDRPDLIRSPEAYLFTIASNIAHEHTLKNSRHPPHIALDDIPPDDVPVDGAAFGCVDPEAIAVRRDRVQRLKSVLSELSPKARATLIWHRRDGHTYNEIGERLGVSRNMVKKYLAQAIAHCRGNIERDSGE
jgi:RNA polymerase sigma factor (sigma-70 family)